MRRALIGSMGVALLSAGCGEGGERAQVADVVPDSLRYGGTVVVAYMAEPSSMNQFASVDENARELQNFVLFTTLIQYDENLQPAPYLAERWDTAATIEGLALTFHLRDGVRWHDGAPTTAHDFKFTFDRIKDPRTGFPSASLLALYDSAVVRDSFTIIFYLKRHPGFLDPWRRISPVPEHILGDVPPARLQQHPFGTESPVGNGPFRFVEHRSGDRWVFEANPDFPESLGGRPYLDRLVYRVIEEPTTRLSELLAGEVDVYLSIEPPQQVSEIEANPAVQVVSLPTLRYTFINWNGRRPLFQDARVRRALTLAINREQIVQTVRNGLGVVAKGPVPPFHWAYHRELEPLPYNPDSARALLEAAGWVDRDGDGIRERDVYRASFELRTNPNPTREDIMTLVQADLRKVGFEVRLRVQEAQSLRRDITSRERPFDAFVLGWGTDFRLDDRILFACSQFDGPFQWASYCNPRVDELLDQVTRLEDRSQALPLWQEYQEILQWEQPYTFLYYDVRPNGLRTRLRDVQMDIRGALQNVKDWWVEPTARRFTP
ncbi:MAG: hypothetical protein JSV41_05870 [Gemmatimonadota bacterium]|nr:MAG: hypothetical protein JSV41_05870 [Gemmatimonadota bacterium]